MSRDHGGGELHSVPNDDGHVVNNAKQGEARAMQGDVARVFRPKARVSNFIRILKYGDKIDWMLMSICAASAIGAGIAMPFMFYIFGNIVSDFVGYFMPFTTITKADFLSAVHRNALYMVILACIKFILSCISIFSIRTSGLRISCRIRLLYMKALFEQPVSKIDDESAGVIAHRLTDNCNTIESGISQHFSLAVQSIAFTVGLFLVSFLKSAQLTLVALAAVPIVVVAFVISLPLMYKASNESNAVRSQASSLAYETFQAIRIVVAFGAGEKLGQKHKAILNRARLIDYKLGPITSGLMAPMFFTIYAVFALTFWRGIQLYNQQKVDGIGTVVVLFSVIWAVTSLFHLYNPMIWLTRAAAASSQIFEVLEAHYPNGKGFVPEQDVKIQDDIVFENISFAYPSRPNSTILQHLDIRFARNQVTAIVGPSGSGKSTIVALLQRWYEPMVERAASIVLATNSVEGSDVAKTFKLSMPTSTTQSSGIFSGGTNVSDLNVKWWRSQIGLVQQEPVLFNTTIYQNIENGLCGTAWEHATEELKISLVAEACRQAYVDEFAVRLPLGLDTVVGEGGLKLSGGQRQRIAIARAIVKKPAILILDEATSSIDVASEQCVQQALDEVAQGRTTIVIAHRLSSIKHAHNIVVLKDGRVSEQGTHQQLMDHNGVYKSLVQAQKLDKLESSNETLPLASPLDAERPPFERYFSRGAQQYQELEPAASPYKMKGFLHGIGLLILDFGQRRRFMLLVVLGVIGAAAAYPLQAYLFGKAVEVFTFNTANMISRGTFWCLMFVVLAITTGLSFVFIGWGAALVAIDVGAHYRHVIYQHLVKRRVEFFDNQENPPGLLTAKMSSDSMQIQQLLGGEIAIQMVGILGIVGSVIIAFYFSWKLSLVGVLVIMPVVTIAGYYRVRHERDVERANAQLFERTARFCSEAIGAFRTVKALTMEERNYRAFDEQLQRHIKRAMKKALLTTVVLATSESIDMFCQALFFWYGGRLLSTKEYNLLDFFVVYMAVIQTSLSLGMWFTLAPNLAKATEAANEILRLKDVPKQDESSVISTGCTPASIKFENVHFTYPDRDVSVLNNINLDIKAGQFAAFVGASGSGKSTLIAMMENFYTPTKGRVLFDGMDIHGIEPASYRENLSLVAQEATLFEGSIRDTVALSVATEVATDSAIEEACGAAQIHDFIVSLPEGYNTQIGSRGVCLSGGQRQRLALARALLRRPRLLLLDEATSNLDSESEALVQQAIEGIAGQATIVAVAHRLATIRKADVIFVIGSGRVQESGSHAELIAQRGIYYQMCRMQAMD